MNRHGREESGWFSKNWGWCLPLGGCLGCLGLIVLVGALATGGLFQLTRNIDLDDDALAIAATNPVVIDALGEPIEKGWTQNIAMTSRDDRIEAEMTFGVKGPKGSGQIHVRGTKEGETWSVDSLEFQPTGSDIRLDLLESEELPGDQVDLRGGASLRLVVPWVSKG